MEPTRPDETPQLSLRERFFKSWFPPAAVVGGVVTLVAAALRVRPEPKRQAPPPAGPPASGPAAAGPLPEGLERAYVLSGSIGTQALSAFRESLLDVAVDASDRVVALGDGHVRVFSPGGEPLGQWRAGEGAECLAVGPDGRIYVGGAGRIEVFEGQGRQAGGFSFGDPGSPPAVSAIAAHGGDILVADASARVIRRFDAAGRQRNLIGDQGKTKTFMLPNGKLDLAVDAAGVVHATDTGRHQVTAWTLDGAPVGKFGKFGMQDPADFVGCCNPTNVAATPDGKIVTSEKMVARVKVFEPGGRLLAVIGTEHFDPMCTQIPLAADSRGRILAADPVRRQIQVFTPAAPGATSEDLR
jgi:sugar lactone lactonase YvrE